ncbi:DNA/RNA nuclease SfsA [Desulfonatronum sp. SC1]|uniref:DNA/RNA nuclease SfsA n=1 Tax=Desulfonatronum sp. SC1 TaxID=2109626 RepID=UPI000D306D7D|nr:DNA/RNA nuclease SfsA [Desulfonatronum sp. SC1]PTN36918.1 DNA/RNA nuclease SfsA [Desulfonatronum sp. SC1]
MLLPQPLITGVLIRRYKRFLADVRLESGEVVTAHTPNTGSMLGCSSPGSRVWLSRAENPKRKYPWTWELTETESGVLVGIHTGRSNGLVWEALAEGKAAELAGYRPVRREVVVENGRLDMLLENAEDRACYVEVKNVTAVDEQGTAIFPDAVSVRASRHLETLAELVVKGHRAVIFFCVQRGDARRLSPADVIDPVYGQTLRRVSALGVEALAWRADVSQRAIVLETPLPVVC